MLFDWLMVGQVVPSNPASSARGPQHVVKKGKTLVLDAEQTRVLLDSIDNSHVVGLRDRALIAAMVFSFARVGAVVGTKVEDDYSNGKRWWLRLHGKSGKFHEVPAHHNAEEYLDAYRYFVELGEETRTAAHPVPSWATADNQALGASSALPCFGLITLAEFNKVALVSSRPSNIWAGHIIAVAI